MYLNLEEDTCATSDVNEQLQLRSASVGVSTTLTAADLGGPEAGIATMQFFVFYFWVTGELSTLQRCIFMYVQACRLTLSL